MTDRMHTNGKITPERTSQTHKPLLFPFPWLFLFTEWNILLNALSGTSALDQSVPRIHTKERKRRYQSTQSDLMTSRLGSLSPDTHTHTKTKWINAPPSVAGGKLCAEFFISILLRHNRHNALRRSANTEPWPCVKCEHRFNFSCFFFFLAWGQFDDFWQHVLKQGQKQTGKKKKSNHNNKTKNQLFELRWVNHLLPLSSWQSRKYCLEAANTRRFPPVHYGCWRCRPGKEGK